MANGFYLKGMKHIGQGDLIWKAAGGTAVATYLVDTLDYTVDLTTHEFRDATGLAAGIEETSAAMTKIDAADDGILDANDVTFTGTTGDTCEGILVANNGTAATSPLYFWWDSASGLPVTLGGDVTVQWDNTTNKIAKI